jgi:Fe-Mn family superoxide dismutase
LNNQYLTPIEAAYRNAEITTAKGRTPMSNEMRRREVFSALAGVGAVAMLTGKSSKAFAEAKASPVGDPGAGSGIAKHAPVALPFDPKKLHGLSEKMIVSHHDNNYVAAVKGLNRVEEELAKANKDTPPFLIAGLKERELTFTNSLVLHEHYFGNLGGDGKPSGAIEQAIGAAFGGFARWEEQFRATGTALAGGSGWAILDLNVHTGQLRTYWGGNHTQTAALGVPLLVMDMYEHAYQMDFGAAAPKYIDAFFANIRWDEVSRRHERALSVLKVIRS